MHPRHSLEEKLDQAYTEWKQAIAGLNDAGFEQMVCAKWNLKDIVGHVYAYLDLTLRNVQSYKKRKRLASPHAPSYSYFNHREAERLRGVPLPRLRANMAVTWRELIELVRSLTVEDLKKQFPAQWSNSTYKTTLRYQLRSTAEHMQMHAQEVKLWRENAGK